MTKEELIELIRDPNQTGQAVDELDRLIEKNPYFHTGHQLYLKGLQKTSEAKMALRLGKTALSVCDRGVLYNYINKPSTIHQQTTPKDQPVEMPASFVQDNSLDSSEFAVHDIESVQIDTTEPSWQQLHEQELTSFDLIDSFLQANPKIVPSESTYEVNLLDGLQEIPDIATETLADIYASQGHKNKAIEIYEQLILKNPEKHIYFAVQIDRLKV